MLCLWAMTTCKGCAVIWGYSNVVAPLEGIWGVYTIEYFCQVRDMPHGLPTLLRLLFSQRITLLLMDAPVGCLSRLSTHRSVQWMQEVSFGLSLAANMSRALERLLYSMTLELHVAGAMLTLCGQQDLLLYPALPFVALAAACRDVRICQACCCAGGSSAKTGAQLQATCRQLNGGAALCFKKSLAPLVPLRACFLYTQSPSGPRAELKMCQKLGYGSPL